MGEKKSIFEKMGLVEKVETNGTETDTVNRKSKLLGEEATNLAKLVHEIKGQGANLESEEVLTNETRFDKHLTVAEIYQTQNMKTDSWNTVFIIDEFLKALPQYLPDSVKRQSVTDIITSSGMQLDKLIQDGKERLTLLQNHLEQFSTSNNKAIQEYEKDIERLTEQINQLKKSIAGIKELQDTQKATIEYETQKISNIIDFVQPSK
ncbi:hypothetical protein [Candidatus Formimonas warabiya]|uniref:Uncharacterized protein n=1 Tax=Formimonas warabiya TaxID=1761012 RepID=A0A3G1KVX4_FORW1|nr:hypothetical protein [Candidatus Formimonas warabiya]ATW26537.1 hypothetical protein DCMF_18865 [Candidatus Formimonas warabiya]